MATQIFLGKPPASIEQWIKDHHGPVVKVTTVVKYTAASGLPDWEGDIVGELTNSSIPNKSDIAEVEIGSHVTSIESSTFLGCTSLISVTIPDSVTSIGYDAFFNTGLTSITIGDNVTELGNEAFAECNSLTNVTIGNSVTRIGDMMFFNCHSLTNVTLGSSVTSIGDQAFQDCYDLTNITIPGNVMSIGSNAFSDCIALTSMTIHDNVMDIGSYAFFNCSGLTSVTFSGKDKATVQGMDNYSWELPSGCVIHCTDGDITI